MDGEDADSQIKYIESLITQLLKWKASLAQAKSTAQSFTSDYVDEFVGYAKNFYISRVHPFDTELAKAAKLILVSSLGYAYTKLNACLPEAYIGLLRSIFTCRPESLSKIDIAVAALVSQVIGHPGFANMAYVDPGDVREFAPWNAHLVAIIFPCSLNYNVKRASDRMSRFCSALKDEVVKHIPCKEHRYRLALDGEDYSKTTLVEEEDIPKIAVYRWLSERRVRGKDFLDIYHDTFPKAAMPDRLIRNLKKLSDHAEKQGIQIDKRDLPEDLERNYNEVME